MERRAGSGECGRRRVEWVSISDDFFIDISVNLLYKGRWHDRSCVMREGWGEARGQWKGIRGDGSAEQGNTAKAAFSG